LRHRGLRGTVSATADNGRSGKQPRLTPSHA
jgi:hypothetical protein